MNYQLYNDVLPPTAFDLIRSYLKELHYTRIERSTMRLYRSLQDDNANNPIARVLVAILKAHGVGRYMAFDDVSIVRYDSGADYVGWHSDGGPLLAAGCAMGLISFGAVRPIEFRRKYHEAAEAREMLPENSLMISPEGFQRFYEHQIPPVETDGQRFSIVLFTHNKALAMKKKSIEQLIEEANTGNPEAFVEPEPEAPIVAEAAPPAVAPGMTRVRILNSFHTDSKVKKTWKQNSVVEIDEYTAARMIRAGWAAETTAEINEMLVEYKGK